MFSYLKRALIVPEIRNKILISFFLVFIFRVVSFIPIPKINTEALESFFTQNELLNLANVFSGGNLSRFSLMSIGLSPYITASIFMQVLTFVVPKLEELSKEGSFGQEKINRYTKLLTIPFAFIQSFGLFTLFSSQNMFTALTIFDIASIILSLSAGAFIAMWLGDLITEQNIGQGISILVLVGILSSIPSNFQSFIVSLEGGNFFNALFFLLVVVVVIAGVVFVNDAVRKIPIAYARSNSVNSSSDSFLPLKVNMAGVIPIIFAVSLVFIPSILGGFLINLKNQNFINVGNFLVSNFQVNGFYYNISYFLLVVLFTFFYTAVTFNPKKIADDLKKHGGFIPGIRPGIQTENYLTSVLTRVTLIGAVFLGLIAVLPSFASVITGFNAISIGGTGVLIIVSVILETNKKIESQVIMRDYDKIGLN